MSFLGVTVDMESIALTVMLGCIVRHGVSRTILSLLLEACQSDHTVV